LHRCCWFYFIKAIGDHVKKEGLLGKYQLDLRFNAFIQQFTILALIKPALIDYAFNHLKDRVTEFPESGVPLGKFIAYFEKEFV